MTEVRKLLESIAARLGKRKEDVDPYVELLEINWYTTLESLKYLSKEELDSMKVPKGLRDLLYSEINKEECSKLTPIAANMANLSLAAPEETLIKPSTECVAGLSSLPHDPLKQDHNMKIEDNNSKVENFVGLAGFINECTSFEEALEILNLEGGKNAVAFKRGNSHYYPNLNKLKDKRIICSKMIRNKPKDGSDFANDTRESYDQVKQIKSSNKHIECPVYYKFKFSETGEISYEKCVETHNHPLELSSGELNEKMLQDIKLFHKRSKIIDVKESLEKKYNIALNYHMVYRELRKIYPRFGKEDAENMMKTLKEKNIDYQVDIDPSSKNVKRLFFSTPRMLRQYELYGDIMLIDSTYRINQYNIPLIVYSGIDSRGFNILFGLAIVNDETANTHQWCLDNFFHVSKKIPNLIVTDQDLALMGILDEKYPEITHFLCQWHIVQNFKKHFSFLQNFSLKNIYEKLLSLPYLIDQNIFETTYKDLNDTLRSKKYIKSSDYLERVYKLKLKWATCYSPKKFTAGIHTTSRIESINALIKKYVNSNSEVSDIFDFLIAFEDQQEARIINEDNKQNNNTHPLLKEMKSYLSTYIYNLHEEQYRLCFRYLVNQNDLNVLNMHNVNPTFKVQSIDSKHQSKHRIVTLVNSIYSCECETFIQCGIVCRHIFYISFMRQEKELSSIRIHPRWTLRDNLHTESLRDLFESVTLNEKLKKAVDNTSYEEQRTEISDSKENSSGTNDKIKFEAKKKKGGRKPKLEQRPKSFVEQNQSASKQNQKNSRNNGPKQERKKTPRKKSTEGEQTNPQENNNKSIKLEKRKEMTCSDEAEQQNIDYEIFPKEVIGGVRTRNKLKLVKKN